MDNEFNVVHVHATSSHVGGHENANRSFAKRGQVAVTLRLRQVSVQVNRGDSSIRELLGKFLGVVLGTHEQDATTGARCERLNEIILGLNRG
ncbi:MAG: hypothetical protein ACJAS7_001131, partial [Alpinimonas sp.]